MKFVFTICTILSTMATSLVIAQEPGKRSISGGRVSVEGMAAPKPTLLPAVEHKKRVYVDESKRIHVALSSPLFVRVALTPVDDPSFLLHQPNNLEVAVPFYLDGPGRHSIQHPGELGRESQGTIMHIYADAEGPTTTALFSGAKGYSSGSDVYYGGGLSVTIESIDDMAGVQQTFASKDDTVFARYTQPFTFTTQGEHRLRYYGFDNVGNSEPVSELSFTIDPSPPVINVRFSNAGSGSSDKPVYPSGTVLEMEAVDTMSGLERLAYAVNSEPERPFSGGVTFDNPGEFTVVIRASDRVGNSENQILRFTVQ